jgi:hypothetical protein
MFLGHFAVGFAAKRVAPRTGLTALITAAIFLDILFPLFLWLGLEEVRIAPGKTAYAPYDFVRYPFSHSLLFAILWAATFALLYRARTRYLRGALVVGAAVLSHWVLDLLSHGPDLPLAPLVPIKLGLGLWNSVPGTVAVEALMFLAGLILYLRTTRARSWWGHVSLWSMIALLMAAEVQDAMGVPPPSLDVMRVASTAALLLIFWFVWIDGTRELRAAQASRPAR